MLLSYSDLIYGNVVYRDIRQIALISWFIDQA